jgi:NADPH:quinone reductase-like Zn-dependent oxidoreductase
MRAIVYERTGGPEVLRVAEVDPPAVGTGQVRVRVRAAAVNPFDLKLRAGAYGGSGLPRIPGVEVAGIVEEVAPDRSDVAVGDAVLGWAVGGGNAELALVERLAPKPAAMAWDVAASLPVAADAARRGLELLGLRPGDTLLVHGAAGSVGGVVVQLAKARGATVIGTAGEANHAHLRALGAVPTTYGPGLVERVRALALDGVDAVFDAAGRGALPASITLRGGNARIVTIADPDAQELGIPFSGSSDAPQAAAALAEALALFERGELFLPIRRVFPLEEAAAAHRLGEDGHGRGKIVLVP